MCSSCGMVSRLLTTYVTLPSTFRILSVFLSFKSSFVKVASSAKTIKLWLDYRSCKTIWRAQKTQNMSKWDEGIKGRREGMEEGRGKQAREPDFTVRFPEKKYLTLSCGFVTGLYNLFFGNKILLFLQWPSYSSVSDMDWDSQSSGEVIRGNLGTLTVLEHKS